MEENSSHEKHGEKGEKSHRARIMGKFFKDKKPTPDVDVDEFLHGPSDKLQMMPTASSPSFAPPLTRIDTSRAPRWPTATEINNSRRARASTSPKRSRKGLAVRFSEDQPEVIGEGGDEATSPVADIGRRKRANTHPRSHQTEGRGHLQSDPRDRAPSYGSNEQSRNMEDFRPGPIQRTQTGAVPDMSNNTREDGNPSFARRGEEGALQERAQQLEPNRRSFADMVKADMRSGEGLALLGAASKSFPLDEQSIRVDPSDDFTVGLSAQFDQVRINTMRNSHIPSPGASLPSVYSRPITPQESQLSSNMTESPEAMSRPSNFPQTKGYWPSSQPGSQSESDNPPSLSRTGTFTLQEAALAVGDDAFQDFSKRVSHLFTLFRLSTESAKPLSRCSLQELVRIALWWFLKGRLNLEATIRDRPSSPQAQQACLFKRQQSYADLAKALWIIEVVTPRYPEIQNGSSPNDFNTPLGDVLESRQGILSNLRKLTMSMKRNHFLPPQGDDAPLTQGLDASIWVQDDGNRSLIASQRQSPLLPLSETLPLGDTTRTFHYARMFVEAVLVEEGASNHYRCPVLISVIRGNREATLTAIITNQDGSLNFCVQVDKSRGPTWADVRWQSKHSTAEVYLPRGFILRLHCSEADFRILWSMYDHEKRTHGSLLPREGEELVFETVLRSFQHFDHNPQPNFPKEPQPQCQLRLFEKTVVEKAATGPRTMHRGFRIGINTSTKTKQLRGVNQELLPTHPVQFGFLRSDGDLPALLLKINDGKSKYTMVSTFDQMNERNRLHSLLAGTALGDAEDIVAEGAMSGFSLANHDRVDLKFLHSLEWKKFSIINESYGDVQTTKTVLSEHLRVVAEFKSGTLTDRINVGPGELRFRLDIRGSNEIKVLRQPQQDMTVSVSEALVSKDLPTDLVGLLKSIADSESTRTFTFPSTQELHLFQAALTGFTVLYDGIASSFNISRRRMVVPIYKKWDAASTRLQIVQKEKVVQLIAFFENFTHGDCMNFTLKSTDIFESLNRSNKFSLRIVDAKFAMPKTRDEDGVGIDHEFVCVDMPEYPGEHDDITIVFESEAERALFTKVLPAPVKVASRMGSVRR